MIKIFFWREIFKISIMSAVGWSYCKSYLFSSNNKAVVSMTLFESIYWYIVKELAVNILSLYGRVFYLIINCILQLSCMGLGSRWHNLCSCNSSYMDAGNSRFLLSMMACVFSIGLFTFIKKEFWIPVWYHVSIK